MSILRQSILLWQAIVLSVAIAMVAAPVTYFRLVRKIKSGLAESATRAEEASGRAEALEKELDKCSKRLEELEQRYVPVGVGPAVPASMHLNRRGQVAQLHRRGETARKIASVLGVPEGEVKLLIKLQEISRTASKG